MDASTMILDQAHDTAIQAALEASQVIMPFWPNSGNREFDERRTLDVFEKEGIGNYATVADLRSEQRIIEVIQSKALFESHGIVAEESDEIAGNAQWRWIIDPIDGTINFRSGNPDFGICIALSNGERIVVGLIAMPALQQFAVAKEGSEAKLFSYNGAEIADLTLLARKFSDRLDNALVGYNLGYSDRVSQLQKVTTVVSKVGYACSLGSYSTENFRLLQGMMGVCFGMSPTVMDVAPAAALIPAVGGVVTNMEGKPIDWNAPSRTYVGAVNPRIHEEFLAALNED